MKLARLFFALLLFGFSSEAVPFLPEALAPAARWREALQQLAAGYNGRFRATGVSEIKKRLDAEHFANLRREIKIAALIAPEGLPAAVLGAGGLRDIPDELFHSPKFPEIVLIDLDLEEIRNAARERGLWPLVRAGKIRFLKADLSMVSRRVTDDFAGIVNSAGTLEDALEVLGGYCERARNGGAAFEFPAELKRESFGLVVSSMLVPNLGFYVKLAVDRLLAARFGLPLPQDPLDGLSLDGEAYARASAAMKLFCDRVDAEHLQMVNRLTDENGVAFAAMIVSMISPKTIGRRDIFINYVAKRAVEADASWGAGKNIVKSGMWLWFNRPDRGKGHFVRSLILTPRHGRSPIVERKEDVTPFVRWQVGECYRWVEENLTGGSV